MNIQVELMPIEQKSLLIQLMELYNYEFTQYDDEDINQYGYFGYSHIDDYWNEPGRYPYLISVEGKIAGFALISNHCEYRKEAESCCFGEFFVMLKYRKKGIGTEVALKLIERHPGDWEILYLKNNTRASSFWKSVMDKGLEQGLFQSHTNCQVDDMAGFIFSNK